MDWGKVIVFIIGIIMGAWVWSIDCPSPTPQECLSVCVEAFE